MCVSTETTYDADHTVYTHNMQTLQTVANQGYSAGAVHLQDGSPTHFAVFNAETCVFDSNTAAVRGRACERSRCWCFVVVMDARPTGGLHRIETILHVAGVWRRRVRGPELEVHR